MAEPRSYKVLSESARVRYRSYYFFLPSLFTSEHLRFTSPHSTLWFTVSFPHCFGMSFSFVAAKFSPILISRNCLYSSCWCYVYPNHCILPSFRMYSFNSLITTNTRNVILLFYKTALKNAIFSCKSFGYRKHIFSSKVLLLKSLEKTCS